MIKSYINTLVMLFFAWGVYGYCQRDPLLTSIAGLTIVVSLFLRFKAAEKKYIVLERMPLFVIAIIAVIIGLLWRQLMPIPEDANAPFLDWVSGFQSASIIAGMLIALRPFNVRNMHLLSGCAWLTVALSSNVPFTQEMLLVFAAFSFIAVAVVIINTMRPPTHKKYSFVYGRDYAIFSTLLIALTISLFFLFTWTVVLMETAFFNTMSNYIMRRHYSNFLNISNRLNLINPGVSAKDRRPVIEVSVPNVNGTYLKMQVFDRYANGSWYEVSDAPKHELPTTLVFGQPRGYLVMFTGLKDLIPAPSGITAIGANNPYYKTDDQLISDEKTARTRILRFSMSPDAVASTELSEKDYARYTTVPETIAPQLRYFTSSIILPEDSKRQKTIKLVQYFRKNFSYSLDVDFSADDKGLIKMLQEKRPAYCTYFASVLALTLRAEGVPARVAAGFLTTERINAEHNTFLARVNNAHAWTEVFLEGKWRTFDATPPNFNLLLTRKDAAYYVELAFEKTWLSFLRLRAWFENADKDQLKIYGILILLSIMFIINHRQIIPALQRWLKQQKKTKITYTSPDTLRLLYQRYEQVLKKQYNEARFPTDTDTDVLTRLKLKYPDADTASLEHFVRTFHAARFGNKIAEELPALMATLEK